MDRIKRRRVMETVTADGSADQEEGYNNAYCLQWNNKSEYFNEELRKLYRQGGIEMTLTDVTLCSSEGQFIQGHKLILSLCSGFFRRLLFQASRKNVFNASNAVIVLAHVKLQPLQHLLQFMYTGEVNILPGDLEGFLQAGEMLQVEGLSGYVQKLTKKAEEKEEDPAAAPPIQIQVTKPVSLNYSLESDQLMDNSNYGGEFEEEDDGGNYEMEGDDTCGFVSEGYDAENCEGGGVSTDVHLNQSGRKPYNQWTEIEPLSEEELAEHWRRRADIKCDNGMKIVRYYYCIHGGFRKLNGKKAPQCAASIKTEVFMGEGGKTVYFNNGLQHCNHREKEFRGMSQEQRDCIKRLFLSGVEKPSDIVAAMEVENVEVPRMSQLTNHLTVLRKKLNPEAYLQKRGRGRPPKSQTQCLQVPPNGRGMGNTSSVEQEPSTSQPDNLVQPKSEYYGHESYSTGDEGGGGDGFPQQCLNMY